ncbi:DUF6069 family protein [Streptomyces sp. NPDC014623]|uniref:DUF6069 family protein n=1 Tax=Streptomyces sp. NPDC014623 TaxID=3364875 RepID=UPI003702AACD
MPTQSPSPAAHPSAARPAPLKIVGLLAGAIVASCITNAIIAALALAAGASDDFQPLQPVAYITFTLLGVLIGAAGWALIRRRADAHKRLRILVPVVVLLSFIPDLAMLVSDYNPHADATGVIALLLMHVAVAAFSVFAFQRALPVSGRD